MILTETNFVKKNILYPFLFALLGLVVSICANIKGPSIPTGDSLSYYNSARSIAANGKFCFPFYELSSVGEIKMVGQEVNTIWPPATSFLLSIFAMVGFNLFYSLIFLISIFTFLSAYLIWHLSYVLTNSLKAANLVSFMLLSMWAFRYWVESSFMAEGLFISATLIAPLYLFQINSKVNLKIVHFVVYGLLLSLSYYVKSVAPAFIIAGLLTIFIFPPTRKFKFLASASLGVFMGVLPWLFRNLSYGTIGSAGSGPLPSTVLLSITEFIRLFTPRHGDFFESKITVIGACLFLIAIPLIFILSVFQKGSAKIILHKIVNNLKINILLVFSVVYSIVFVVILIVSIYVLQKTSFIEMRYWLVLLPFILPSAYILLREIYFIKAAMIRKMLFYIPLTVYILSVALNIIESYRNSDRVWNRLPLNQAANAYEIHKLLGLNRDIRFFSNSHVRFETYTGLTDWDRVIKSDTFTGRYCYVAFPPEPFNTMVLDSKATTLPIGWLKIASLNGIQFYVDPTEVKQVAINHE
jgi:hypothetical protein